MELDFIDELDAAFSNVGSDLLWKRSIGGIELWISPIQFSGQEKVVEAASKIELGANIINESKRITLSHAIVGVGEHDLREYRTSTVFPVVNKEGKTVKTTLDKYIYYKLGTWGFDFVNNVFLVYADLMETLEKNSLKDIKFDNAKDLREELAELQAKVYELRHQLGMPPLIEGTESPDEMFGDETPGDETPDESGPEDSGDKIPFDPFSVISHRPVHQSKQVIDPRPPTESHPQPEATRLVAEGGEITQRARELAAVESSFLDQTPTPVVVSGPPVQSPPVQSPPVVQTQPMRNDVLEQPASRDPVSRPVIDRTNISINPRFKPPGRVT